MTFSRRSAMKLLGMAPAAAPLTVKATQEAMTAGQMGLRLPLTQDGGSPSPAPSAIGNGPANASYETAANYARVFGIPEHVDTKLRDDTYHVWVLDPDIAVKRSFSMAAKITYQRQRNYERARQEIFSRVTRRQMSSAFEKLTGWAWPFW